MFDVKIVNYSGYSEQINRIRCDVFVKEQGVPLELEIDGLDAGAVHALVFDGDTPVGTGRLLEDGHIGRVAVQKSHRGRGVGICIIEGLLDAARAGNLSGVWLGAQCHAKGFYRQLGFSEFGDIFLDAGIDHIKMKKSL